MEKIIKEFKSASTFLGFLAVMQILNLLTNLSTIQAMDISVLAGVEYASLGIPESTMLNIMKVCAYIPYVVGAVVLGFLSIKGVKEANDPSSAKFHLILAVISAVVFALCAIEAVGRLFNNPGDVIMTVLDVVVCAADAALLVLYFHYGKQIRTKE